MIGCNFCNKIYAYSEIFKMSIEERCSGEYHGRFIEYDKVTNSYGLWVECKDDYYSDRAMDINYCPVCGRKMDWSEEE